MHLTRLLTTILFISFTAQTSYAEIMTVEQLRNMISKQGQVGEVAATSYFQGVVEGMMAMEAMRRNGLMRDKEFCKLFDAVNTQHPAYRTKQVIAAWEREGKPMETIAPDMVLSFLSSQYGC